MKLEGDDGYSRFSSMEAAGVVPPEVLGMSNDVWCFTVNSLFSSRHFFHFALFLWKLRELCSAFNFLFMNDRLWLYAVKDENKYLVTWPYDAVKKRIWQFKTSRSSLLLCIVTLTRTRARTIPHVMSMIVAIMFIDLIAACSVRIFKKIPRLEAVHPKTCHSISFIVTHHQFTCVLSVQFDTTIARERLLFCSWQEASKRFLAVYGRSKCKYFTNI